MNRLSTLQTPLLSTARPGAGCGHGNAAFQIPSVTSNAGGDVGGATLQVLEGNLPLRTILFCQMRVKKPQTN